VIPLSNQDRLTLKLSDEQIANLNRNREKAGLAKITRMEVEHKMLQHNAFRRSIEIGITEKLI
jgi:hypothetical protein